MVSSVLQALRAATAENHQRLESRLPLADICAQPSHYQRFLQAYWGFYSPVEAQLDAAANAIPSLEWAVRRKTRLLEQDLSCLGVSQPQLSRLAQCSELPDVASPGSAVGTLYVLEGATLGGRHILKRMGDTLGPLKTTTFLGGYGRSTGEMWRRFIDCLETVGSTGAHSVVVEAAVETFTSFERWLEKEGVLK